MQKTFLKALSLLIILFWSACDSNQRRSVDGTIVTTEKPTKISLMGDQNDTSGSNNQSATIPKITIDPMIRMKIDETLPIRVTITYPDGTTAPLTSGVDFISDDPDIVTVESDGVLHALQAGKTVIHAIYQNEEAEVAVEVLPASDNKTSQKIPYECPATEKSEKRFQDSFATNAYHDIDPGCKVLFEDLSVNEIEALFNRARSVDPTITEPMLLPPQDIWDSYTSSQKVLYLVNAARCARGIRPMEGIDETLLNDVTKPYAEFISQNEALFLEDAHRADGKTPDERMQDAGIVLGENSDYYGENIAMAGVAAPDRYMQIYQPEAKAVYAWLYQDKVEQYGHRNFILRTGYHDDTGAKGSEGLLAAYTATVQYHDDKGLYWTKSYTVMDGFDPAPSWDYHLTDQERVTLYRRVRE